MSRKKWKWISILLCVMAGTAGCSAVGEALFGETGGYGQRNAEQFSAYLQGMEFDLDKSKQNEMEKRFNQMPVWTVEEPDSEVQAKWIQFEETLRAESVPIGYDSLESFLETERSNLDEKTYQRAMELVDQWMEIPEGDESNLAVEAELDHILSKLELTFVDLVSMVNDQEAFLGVYEVENKKLVAKDPIWLRPMERSDHQEKIIQKIWGRVDLLIPEALLNRVEQFAVVTDGEENTMAYVYPMNEGLEKWHLTVDYLDFVDEDGKLELDMGDETLLHEFGHILSLNETQMDNHAEGTLQLDEGVLAKRSYLNRFYQRFWRKLEEEWSQARDDSEFEDALFDFYLAHENEFLNDYAATSPSEDFAETFAQFILREQPTSTVTTVDEKIIFFYQFQELVAMRKEIRSRMNLLE